MGSRTVVVGASVGGIKTVQALRSQGYAGELIVVEAESHLPYDKPPLSKGYLNESLGRDRVNLISEAEINSLGIGLRLGVGAKNIEVAGSEIILEDGGRIGYDNLIVATGVRARLSPWEAKDGVHLLRTIDDAEMLRKDFHGAQSVIVVGGGFIGAEVAAAARHHGLEVTIVDPLEVPMGRVLGDSVGTLLIKLHHLNGVATHFGNGVEAITGSKGDLTVELTDGMVLYGDLVVVGIGAVPNTEWLASSGLLIDNGLVCDEYCRAAGQANIFGVGDVARWLHPKRNELVRVEHWTNAVEQAGCVAHNIVNPNNIVSYAPIPYVWSDQYDWKIQIAGETARVADFVLVEDPSSENRFAAVYVDHSDRFCGVVTVNWPKAMIQCRRLLESETDISRPLKLLNDLLPGNAQ